jgi:lycopene cyclase domain-containing protein
MRSYTIAALAALLVSLVAVGVAGPWRDRSVWLGFGVFAALTIVADVALTGVGVYTYDRRFNAGLYLGHMPLEDLAYGLALYLIAVTVWSWIGEHAR